MDIFVPFVHVKRESKLENKENEKVI